MNRAAQPDTCPLPAYHPPLPLNTSSYRNSIKAGNDNRISNNSGINTSIASSSLTPCSTTPTLATNTGIAPWHISKAATASQSYRTTATACYKDDSSCYTPTTPLPSTPADSNVTQQSTAKLICKKRSRTAGASPSPYSVPSALAFSSDTNIWTTAPSTIKTPIVIDTVSTTLITGQLHYHKPETVGHSSSGAAAHRYASILPSPREITRSSSLYRRQQQQQQLPSPLPSPVDHNDIGESSNADAPTPTPTPTPTQCERGQHPTASSSFPFPCAYRQPEAASHIEDCPKEHNADECVLSDTANTECGHNDIIEQHDTTTMAGRRLRTTSLYSSLASRPSANMATLAPAIGMNIDRRVMPWLQEAMQTVSMLESRLQDLEEDCKVIPLYEQERQEMIRVIQDLNTVIQQDQGWISNAETAIKWISYVLENSQTGSQLRARTKTHSGHEGIMMREERNNDIGVEAVIPAIERNTRSEGMLPALQMTHSDMSFGSLFSSFGSRNRFGTGEQPEERASSGQLLKSNVNPFQPGENTTNGDSITDDKLTITAEKSENKSETSVVDSETNDKKQKRQQWNIKAIPAMEISNSKCAPIKSTEALYRNAIMVTLRHLKTIDLNPSLSTFSSLRNESTERDRTRSSCEDKSHSQKSKHETEDSIRLGKRRDSMGMAPDKALKDWLDNSSMMSLVSDIIAEDSVNMDKDEREEMGSDEFLSVSRVLASVEMMGRPKNCENLDMNEIPTSSNTVRPPSVGQTPCPYRPLIGTPLPHNDSNFGPTINASIPLDTTTPAPFITTYTSSNSTESLDILPTASQHATISGSSQSILTNLGNTLMDERVYLKQHIQMLGRLRIQELERHQRVEQRHRQLIQDLERFSKEFLGSVNELTCAQAALNEASELVLLTLSTLEKDMNIKGGHEVIIVSSTKSEETQQQKQQQQQQLASKENTTEDNSQGTIAKNNIARQRQLIAASRRELEISSGLTEECIKRIRRLAADCVGITELAASQGSEHHSHQTSSNLLLRPLPPQLISINNAIPDKENRNSDRKPDLQKSESDTSEPLSQDLKAIPTTAETFVSTTMVDKDHLAPPPPIVTEPKQTLGHDLNHRPVHAGITPKGPSSPLPSRSALAGASMFVDGIAFQEFEEHLSSVRSSYANTVASESTLIKRAFLSSTARVNNKAGSSSGNRCSANQNIDTTVFMKKVLIEDIYPCLLIHYSNGRSGRTGTLKTSTSTKQNHGWMGSLRPFVLTPSSSAQLSTGPNIQTQWIQQLLKAIETNTCEIEAWKPSAMTSMTSTMVNMAGTNLVSGKLMQVNKAPSTTGGSAPKVACCLCGLVRPCEFRLRFLNSSSFTSAHYDSSPVTSSSMQQQQQQQQHYHALDRFCRERIVAVCDFYMFLTHLRLGLLDQPSSLELFRRVLALRQRMAHARIGSVDLVQNCVAVEEENVIITRE
ncbi:hypothetical protein FBU30_003837 [Linnemannia zychae]|nr:hypothetical protein FBU30_003837 [Linnemannia zychae]